MRAAIVCVVALFVSVSCVAHGQSYDSILTLDEIPDQIYAGEVITFTGKLTGDGSPLYGETVWICEDDPFIPDECFAYGVTDNAGGYAIYWISNAGVVEIDWDVYAKFDGSGSYLSDQTPRYTMSVYKYGGFIQLDPIPERAAYGDVLFLSGTLSLDAHNPEGSVIYIKDEDTLNPDDLLTTAYVNASGGFETFWIVADVDPDYTIDIQAVYEGGPLHYRLATPIQELYGYNDTRPVSGTVYGDTYMELYRSLEFELPPRVAIVPSPDSYNDVRAHVVPVQEGILGLSTMLEQRYPTGNWDVDFDVVVPGDNFDARPDVIVNLVTRDDDSGCNYDMYGGVLGWASINMPKPVPTTVCSYDHRTNIEIGATAVHEFVHAIGLGHTFNLPGDLMCSYEDDYGLTCPNDTGFKSATFSDLNLAAIAAIYGQDGYTNPNNHIVWGERFGVEQSGPPATNPIIKDAPGSSVPGCGNDCFIPYMLTIGVGDEVTWTNSDNAAHTTTSGTPQDGPDGFFDSSLRLPNTDFTVRFDEAGEYPYYCVVHPWMTGLVVVK